MQCRTTRVLNLKSTDILDYFCTLFGALTPKTKNSDGGGSTSRSLGPIWCYLLSYTVVDMVHLLGMTRHFMPNSLQRCAA